MVKGKKVIKKKVNGDIPKEEEKISARRAARVAKKIAQAKKSWQIGTNWWSEGKVNLLDLGLTWLLSLYLVWPFFGREAFVTSYSGPVIPVLASLITWSGLPLTYAVEVVNIVFFLLFPLAFYFFIKKVSQNNLVALLAVLVVSLPMAPFAGARIRSAFFSVEGPHMASLAVVPIAVYGLISFLKDGGIKSLLIATFTSVLVGLISPFGLLTYFIFAIMVVFSEVLLGHGRLKIFRALIVLLMMGGLSSFWYNPRFFLWLFTGSMGMELKVMVARLLPVSFVTVPIFGVFGYLLFDRKPKLQPLFLACSLTLGFMVIVLTGGGFMPSTPSRYIPELGLALAFLLSVVAERAWELIKERDWRWKKIRRDVWANGLLLGLIAGLVWGVWHGRDHVLAYERGVLGWWTGVSRGEIWRARDEFGGWHRLLGYLISLITLGLSGWLWKKTKAKVR